MSAMIALTVQKIVASTRLFLLPFYFQVYIIITCNKIFAPLYFVVFVLLAQFVLVNVVVAVLMKHLEETHKQVRIDYIYLFRNRQESLFQVKFEDLFLVQCFNLVFLQFKERLLNMVGKDLNRKSLKLKQDLIQKIETYFD